MAKQRHLTSAPIAEAVVDIRTALPKDFDVTSLSQLPSEIAERFPQSEPITAYSGKFEYDIKLKLAKAEAIDGGVVGHLFKTTDATKALQFRNDGFTFSKLKPYQDWARLRDEALDLWRIYVRNAKPESVSRVALRYINHLSIPFAGDRLDLDEYLTSSPKVPAGDDTPMPQGIASFFYRVVLPDPSIGAIAIIHQALESVTDSRTVPVILDIDAYIQGDLDPTSDKIWEAFEQLHDFKNRLFFAYITEKTAELFE